MITVYVNLLLPDRKEQRGILCQTDCVGRLVVRRRFMVLHTAGTFCGNVLIKRPAQHDIEQLHTPADPQHRFFRCKHQRKQSAFHLIALRAERAAGLPPLFPIKYRVQIVAAGEQKTVKSFSIIGQCVALL